METTWIIFAFMDKKSLNEQYSGWNLHSFMPLHAIELM